MDNVLPTLLISVLIPMLLDTLLVLGFVHMLRLAYVAFANAGIRLLLEWHCGWVHL